MNAVRPQPVKPVRFGFSLSAPLARQVARAAVVLTAAVLTACGGDSSKSVTSPDVAPVAGKNARTRAKTTTQATTTTTTAAPASQTASTSGTTTTLATQTTTTKSSILYGVTSDVSWYNDANYRTTSLTTAKNLNAKVLRVGLLWMWIEYKKGHYDWTIPDHIVNTLTAAGIQPIFNVFGSPEWASGVKESANEYFYLYVPTNSTSYNSWVTNYSAFVTAAAQRYKGKVTMWELGNEMNDAWFWRPKPDVAQYATWFSAMQTAIKKVDPTAKVASGGLNGLADNLDAPGIGARAFLQGLYDRNIYPDYVAIHPYSNMGQSPMIHIAESQVTNFDDITMMHNFMVSKGQGSHPLWITEWGWTLDNVSASVQADYLTKSLNLLESNYSSYVTVATYYSEFDPSSVYHYGLYTSNFVARPAATAFKTFMTGR